MIRLRVMLDFQMYVKRCVIFNLTLCKDLSKFRYNASFAFGRPTFN
jgi:hypothetical protein